MELYTEGEQQEITILILTKQCTGVLQHMNKTTTEKADKTFFSKNYGILNSILEKQDCMTALCKGGRKHI